MGSLRDLVERYVRHPDLRLWPWIEIEDLERTIAAVGEGPDPLEGELPVGIVVNEHRGGLYRTLGAISNVLNPLGWLTDRVLDPVADRLVRRRKYDFTSGALLTDRRFAARTYSGEVSSARYDAISDVQATGSLAELAGITRVRYRSGGKVHTMGVPAHTVLRRFLAEASALAQRGDAVPEQGYEVADPTSDALLAFVSRQRQQGRLSDADAESLQRQIALLHRTIVSGRGSHAGRWVSLLTPASMERFFRQIFGEPTAAEGQETPTLEFVRAKDVLPEAFVDPLRLMGSKKVRVAFAAERHPTAGAWTGYRVESYIFDWAPTHRIDADLLYVLHQRLLAFEAEVLLRQIALGPATDPVALWAPARTEIEAALGPLPAERDFRVIAERVAALPPDPPPNTPPAALRRTATANALGGILTFLTISGCCCSFSPTWLLQGYLDAELSAPQSPQDQAFVYAYFASVLASPLRTAGGLVLALSPRSARWIGPLLVAMGLTSLFCLDVCGILASALTWRWLRRPEVRAYLTVAR